MAVGGKAHMATRAGTAARAMKNDAHEMASSKMVGIMTCILQYRSFRWSVISSSRKDLSSK